MEIQKVMEPNHQLRLNVQHGSLVRLVGLVRLVAMLGRLWQRTKDSTTGAKLHWRCHGRGGELSAPGPRDAGGHLVRQ